VNELLYGIQIVIITPNLALNFGVYPLSWHVSYRKVYEPMEISILQIGPFSFFVNRAIKVGIEE